MARNQRAPPIPAEQEGTSKDSPQLSGLSSPNFPHPPVRRRNTSMQRHSQVDPRVSQDQVGIPSPDGPCLGQSGRRERAATPPSSSQQKSARAPSCRGWLNTRPSKQVGLWSGMSPRVRPCQACSSCNSSPCWLKKTHQHKSSCFYLSLRLKPLSSGSIHYSMPGRAVNSDSPSACACQYPVPG